MTITIEIDGKKIEVEKNISSLIYEDKKYLMFYDDNIDNNVKIKFDQTEEGLIKSDKEFKGFVKNISENFKNIISSSSNIIYQNPVLDFLKNKIFLLIEDTTGKDYRNLS